MQGTSKVIQTNFSAEDKQINFNQSVTSLQREKYDYVKDCFLLIFKPSEA